MPVPRTCGPVGKRNCQPLRRQARQASRYRNISGAIRSAEAELLSIQRASAETARAAAQAALHDAGQAVAAATEAATVAGARATDAAASLPPLRDGEAAARTSLERRRRSSRDNWRPRPMYPDAWPTRCDGWNNCAATWGMQSNCAAMPPPPSNACAPRQQPWQRRMPDTRREPKPPRRRRPSRRKRCGWPRPMQIERPKRQRRRVRGCKPPRRCYCRRNSGRAGWASNSPGRRRNTPGSAPSRSIPRNWTRPSGSNPRPNMRRQNSVTRWTRSSKCGRPRQRHWRRRGRLSPAPTRRGRSWLPRRRRSRKCWRSRMVSAGRRWSTP